MQKEPAAERERDDGNYRCGEETATVMKELRHATKGGCRAHTCLCLVDDEIDELARHDDRLPDLAAVQVRLHLR
jgi:hypothetical protein